MNAGNTQPVAAQPPGTVNTNISSLKSILDRLNAKTERLATALTPILKPMTPLPPTAPSTPCEGFSSECQVAAEIVECLSTIQHIETVIEETIDRLDL